MNDSSAATNRNDAAAGATCTSSLNDDDHNCGACGHDCTLCGGTCEAGTCTIAVLDAEVETPRGLAVDSSYVYYTDEVPYLGSGGSVYAIPKSGGSRVTLATGQRGPMGIAVDATGLYWADGVSSTGAIMKLPPQGSTPVAIATNLTTTDVSVEDGNVVWGDASVYGTTWELPAGSNTPIAIDSVASSNLVLAGGVAYYVSNQENKQIRRAVLGGGAPAVIATVSGLATDQPLAVSGETLFVATYDSGSSAIESMPLAGGTPTVLVPDAGGITSSAIAADESGVYWGGYSASTGDGRIFEAGRDGSNPTMLGSGYPEGAEFLAIDDHCVYFDTFNGGVMAVAK